MHRFATPTLLFVLRYTLGLWLRWRFRVTIRYDETFRGLTPPFLVLPNHVNFWDPFLVAVAFDRPVHFIAADGNFRSRTMRRLLTVAAAIPKTKAKNDFESLRALRKRVAARQIVAVFAEGQRTWDGRNRPLLPATPKLVKLLGVPVVGVRLAGAYLSTPRWATNLRRGRLEITISTILDAGQVRTFSRRRIAEELDAAVRFDEGEWQRERGVIFVARNRAEGAERALFLCSACNHWGTLRSAGALLRCRYCGETTWFAPSGSLYRVSASAVAQHHRFRHLADWNGWQRAALRNAAETDRPSTSAGTVESPARPFPYRVGRVRLLTGFRSRPLSDRGEAALTLDTWELRLDTAPRAHRPGGGATFVLPIAEITGVNVQYAHQLEFYVHGTLFVIRALAAHDSVYRIEESISALQRRR
ncbi:MAG: 1-acyl-sn-glycerol-3-phosphate acyltransferase [Spirochaetales bacterium]|nr:1-acyl-sn-glycerol-3-phosphate acyltransferase [Spirochaetales bacterium]